MDGEEPAIICPSTTTILQNSVGSEKGSKMGNWFFATTTTVTIGRTYQRYQSRLAREIFFEKERSHSSRGDDDGEMILFQPATVLTSLPIGFRLCGL